MEACSPMKADPDTIIRRWQDASGAKTNEVGTYLDEIQRFVHPSGIAAGAMQARIQDGIHDSTAGQALADMAAGIIDGVCPPSSQWFTLSAQDADDAAKNWLHEATTTMRRMLQRSNFYGVVREVFLDRGGFGTACMFADMHQGALRFEHFSVREMAFCEDAQRRASCFFRRIELTARQAVEKFGEDALPDEVRARFNAKNDESKRDYYLHAIYPRDDYDPRKATQDEMPVADVYLHEGTKKVVKEGGFREAPAFITRHMRWGRAIWGNSPAMLSLPDIKSLNNLEGHMDLLARTAAIPRVLVHEDQETAVDLRAGGITLFRDPERAPREWATAGRYDIGQARAQEKRDRIKQAFHASLWRQFSELTREITAREVDARENEAVRLFGADLAEITTEFLAPMLARVFSLLFRSGAFGTQADVPQSMQPQPGALRMPAVEFNGRLSLALARIQSAAWDRTIERVGMIAPIAPDVIDNFDADAAVRDLARGDGIAPDHIRNAAQVDGIRKKRAQEQMAQAAAAAAMQAAAKGQTPAIPAA